MRREHKFGDAVKELKLIKLSMDSTVSEKYDFKKVLENNKNKVQIDKSELKSK